MKKIILILLLTIFVCLAVAEDMDKLDKEKYMPQKLIINELPDDYPRDLEELFKFYYKTVKTVSDYDHELYIDNFYIEKLQEYMDHISLEKKIHYRYLIWLANQTIPLYYAEYYSINCKTIIPSIPRNKMKSKSILPDRFWEKRHNSHFTGTLPIIAQINNKIHTAITDKYPEKLTLLSGILSRSIYIKCEILEEKLVDRKRRKAKGTVPEKVGYIKCKVLDSFGNEFKQDTVIVRIIYPSNDRYYYLPDFTKTKQKGEKYFLTIRPRFSKSHYVDKPPIFAGKQVNDISKLTFRKTIFKKLDQNKSKEIKFFLGGRLKSVGTIEEFKKNYQKVIEFLKENGKGGS